jgi:hypothetical protein
MTLSILEHARKTADAQSVGEEEGSAIIWQLGQAATDAGPPNEMGSERGFLSLSQTMKLRTK